MTLSFGTTGRIFSARAGYASSSRPMVPSLASPSDGFRAYIGCQLKLFTAHCCLSLCLCVCPCVAHTRVNTHECRHSNYWQKFFSISLILLLIEGFLQADWRLRLKADWRLISNRFPTGFSTEPVTFLRLGFLQRCHRHARHAVGCFLCRFDFFDLSLFVNTFGKWKSLQESSHLAETASKILRSDRRDEGMVRRSFFVRTFRSSPAVGHSKWLAKVPSQATCFGRVLKLYKPKSLKIALELFRKLYAFEVFTYSGKPVYSRYGEEDSCIELNAALRNLKAGAKVAPQCASLGFHA